jgi:hypothetical protein
MLFYLAERKYRIFCFFIVNPWRLMHFLP